MPDDQQPVTEEQQLPIAVVIPHAGLAVPPEVAGRVALSAAQIFNEADAYADLLYDFRGRVLHWLFNRGQYPVGGNDHTLWMTANELALPFGLVTTTATYRQVVQVGDWDRSTSILSTGQSGQPGSPHYADHIDLWREGEQHPMLWSRTAVDDEAEATLWLRPPAAL